MLIASLNIVCLRSLINEGSATETIMATIAIAIINSTIVNPQSFFISTSVALAAWLAGNTFNY